MRPPILRWKVMLALLVVVIGGASLGSALHSNGPAYRSFYVSGINAIVPGGWTGYKKPAARDALLTSMYTVGSGTGLPTAREMNHGVCAKLKKMLRHPPKGYAKADLRAVFGQLCKKRR